MYQVIEVSLADLNRLYQYKQNDAFKADFSLKGFDYPWILCSHPWKPTEKVLDVGAAYSPLPIHIQREYGSEVWVADDFGLSSDDPFWTRNASPQEHIANYPEVKYLLERLGDPQESSLPENYFDVIYSASTLEHVPGELTGRVWKHMDYLLKPGGEMLHAIDVPFPSNGGLRKMVMAVIFDVTQGVLPKKMRMRHFLTTPKNYLRLVFEELGLQAGKWGDLSVTRMVLNPQVLTESYQAGLNRIVKDKMAGYQYQRVGSLLIHLKKMPASA
jgi:ubiquinone/menaquinone biosynthesis C-methylase UbiE